MKQEDVINFADTEIADALAARKRARAMQCVNVVGLLVSLTLLCISPHWWLWAINSTVWVACIGISASTLRTIRSRIRILENFARAWGRDVENP